MLNKTLLYYFPATILILDNTIVLSSAQAQIIPDKTTNTKVTNTSNSIQIDQGDQDGANLFHSFKEFSVPTGREAFFNNSGDIVNIFSRVTGGNISNIDGLIRANGAANLFLINPAGILFGENASLQIGGSFYGSTADSIIFPNDIEFAASNSVPPVLTVNAPIGLRFRDNPGDIVNKSVTNGFGLIATPGQSLALIGGNITLEKGRISSLFGTGYIELGSVGDNSVVDLEPSNFSFKLGYNQVVNFRNITLDQDAIIGSNSASIKIIGDRIALTNSSQIGSLVIGSETGGDINIEAKELYINNNSNVVTNTLGAGNSGNITINAAESIQVGTEALFNLQNVLIEGVINPDENLTTQELLERTTGIVTGSQSLGNTGDITINTSLLQLQQGGVLGGATTNQGDLGKVKINATESLSVVGGGIFNNPLIRSIGKGNLVEINTKNLTISDGGLINVSTLGLGEGGDINIVASEQINILRTPSDALLATGIFANTSFGNASAGNITINTPKLNLEDGGQITSVSGIPTNIGTLPEGGIGGNITINDAKSITISGIAVGSNVIFPSGFSTNTSSNSNAGNITVNTDSLSVTKGAQISANTSGQGRGGVIRINTTENLEIIGIENFDSGIFSSSEVLSNGDAGGIRITTANFTIRDRGQISVNSEGQGDGGILRVTTNFLNLDNGSITADTNSGISANVALDIKNHLILDNNSLISARAFNDATNSGNVNIESSVILAFPSQKPNNGNDIIAFSQEASGGNISVTAEAILGIEERPANLANGTNDIDASSEFSSNLVSETRLVDRGLSTANVIESDQVVDQACEADTNTAENTNTFVITGKGGIPTAPKSALDAEVIFNGKNPITTNSFPLQNHKINSNTFSQIQPVKTSQGNIYPARGILVNPDGTVSLTAYVNNHSNQRIPNNSLKCN